MTETCCSRDLLKDLLMLRLPDGALERWKRLCVDSAVPMPQKVVEKFIVPTQQEIDTWVAAPKTLKSLRQIKHPLLCGWLAEECVEAMLPYVYNRCCRYMGGGSPEDNEQSGRLGVLQALRTDAGIAPFATHCFKHIWTQVRRTSRSKVVKDNDRMPVVTRLRMEIGSFLSGNFLKAKRDLLAHDWKRRGWPSKEYHRFSNFDSIPGNMLRDKLASLHPSALTRIVEKVDTSGVSNGLRERAIDEEALIVLRGLPNSDELIEQVTKQALEVQNKIDVEAKKEVDNLVKRLKQKGLTIKPVRMSQDDFEMCWVQRTDNSRARQSLIKGSYKLFDLGFDTVHNMLDYLDLKFNQGYQPTYRTTHLLPIFDTIKVRTVSDLINHILSSPCLRQNTTALDVKLDGEEVKLEIANERAEAQDPAELMQAQDTRQVCMKLLDEVFSSLKLTNEQRTVMCFAWGLPLERSRRDCIKLNKLLPGRINEKDVWTYTPPPCDMGWIASNFGTITGKEDGPITRERVRQYEQNFRGKVIDEMFNRCFTGHPAGKRLLELYANTVKLSHEEHEIGKALFGLYGQQMVPIERIIDNYDEVDPQRRRVLVKSCISAFKQKVCMEMFT